MASVSVWPVPSEVIAGEKVVWIASDVELLINRLAKSTTGHEEVSTWSEQLRTYFQSLLFEHGFVPEKLHPLHQDFEPSVSARRRYVRSVVLSIIERRELASDEQYNIRLDLIDDAAAIECEFSSFKAGNYALQTLKQLFYKHSEAVETVLYSPFAPFVIHDKPVFEHRGINLDIARNRIDARAVMRTVNGMASAKLNRLHLHATDSQSWPLEVPALPELAQKGAYHPSQIWTAATLETVQKYGERRGVEVFLEIGMPGHFASIHRSHPELIVGYDLRPWEPWAAEPPSGQLKLNSEEVHDFVKTLLRDVLPRVAKFSRYFHIGTDEINAKIYSLDPGVMSSDPDVIKPALQRLINVVMDEVLEAGLVPIAWEELLLDWNIKLPESTIIQVWRTHDSLAKVVKKGHRAIFGPSSHWYLDGGQGSWVDPDPENKNSPVKPLFSTGAVISRTGGRFARTILSKDFRLSYSIC